MYCPIAVGLLLWRQVIEAADGFMVAWASKAATLGWDTASVFGCSAIAPEDRLDLAGLIWFIEAGDKITAMSETAAVIRKKSGSTQTFRRSRPEAVGDRVVCAWELEEDPRRPVLAGHVANDPFASGGPVAPSVLLRRSDDERRE